MCDFLQNSGPSCANWTLVRLPDGSFKGPEGEFKGIVQDSVITVITDAITIIKRVITVITGLFLHTITPPGGIFV